MCPDDHSYHGELPLSIQFPYVVLRSPHIVQSCRNHGRRGHSVNFALVNCYQVCASCDLLANNCPLLGSHVTKTYKRKNKKISPGLQQRYLVCCLFIKIFQITILGLERGLSIEGSHVLYRLILVVVFRTKNTPYIENRLFSM